MEQICKSMGIIHTKNPVYHPQANPTERVNRVLKTMIVSFLGNNHGDWDLHLNEFRFAYNTAVHGSLKVSPAFLNFGWDPLPFRSMRRELEGTTQHKQPDVFKWTERMKRLIHLRDWVTKNLNRAFENQARYYDNHHRNRSFKVGDLVLKPNRKLSNKSDGVASKLLQKFEGPFKIKRRLSPVVYTLVTSDGKFAGKEHIRNLKPFVENNL